MVAAIAARQQGLSVMVADGADHPNDKPCGEGLIPEAQAILTSLNIHLSKDAGCRFRGIRFLQREKKVCTKYPEGEGLGLRRTLLHEVLVAKAEEDGAELLWKTPVTGIDPVSVELKQGRVTAKWIVGADGSGSRVRRWSGLAEESGRRQRFAARRHYRVPPWSEYIEIYWGECRQVYVTPVATDEVCIVILAESVEDTKFAKSLENWPELQDRLAGAEMVTRERGAITSMQTLKNVYRGNVALVGDASGSVDAITGEGLRLAFQQGLELAEAMKCSDLSRYQSAHRRLMRRPTWMGELMLLMGRNAVVRERTMQSLAARPQLFQQLLSIHVGASSTRRMIGAGARLGWEFLAA